MYKTLVVLCLIAVVHGISYTSARRRGDHRRNGRRINYGALKRELVRNRATWTVQAANRVYKQTIKRQCFCQLESLGPFVLTVKSGIVINAVPDNEFVKYVPTVEKLFDKIKKAIQDKAAKIDVNYHPTLGYPIKLYIDMDERIADEEMGYEVLSLEFIQEPHESRPGHPEQCQPPSFSVSKESLSKKSHLNGFDYEEWKDALNKWNQYRQSIGCNYKYKLRRVCFCFGGFGGPFIIKVEDGAVVDAKFEKPTVSKLPENLPTITELFKEIFDEAQDADEVIIEYDGSTGIPKSARFDRIARAIDDEVTFEVELL